MSTSRARTTLDKCSDDQSYHAAQLYSARVTAAPRDPGPAHSSLLTAEADASAEFAYLC